MKVNSYLILIALVIIAVLVAAIATVFLKPAGTAPNNTSDTVSIQPLPTDLPAPTLVGPYLVTATEVPPAGPVPEKITWFGSVQDSFGKPFGGISVTLHLMNDAGEVRSVTNRSVEDLPYIGSYVFENVSTAGNATYAYVEADTGDLTGDGVTYHGRSDNVSLNREMISSGFVVLHVPMPDAVKVTAENARLFPANVALVNNPDNVTVVNSTQITAQLYLNGAPYRRSGVTISFLADSEATVQLPGVTTNVTDTSGRATISLAAKNPGTANVTAFTRIGISRNLTDTCTVSVQE